jgi:hypothetical protein
VFISHPHQQQSSFGAVYRDLSDDFVEALAEKFFPYGTDAFSSCLPMFQGFIEGLF